MRHLALAVFVRVIVGSNGILPPDVKLRLG